MKKRKVGRPKGSKNKTSKKFKLKRILPEMLKGDWYTWFTDDGYLVFKIGPLKGRSF
jgi:hypothetical protein